jgi:hypothetical protein
MAVSQEFLDAAAATTRRVKAKVQITWTDPFIDSSIEVAVNESNRISWPRQVADLAKTPSYKWATLNGSFLADGNSHVCPSEDPGLVAKQLGWWGSRLSDEFGFFATSPTLTMTMSPRPIIGTLLVGNSVENEYPIDFDIAFYNGSNVLLHTDSVTGNALMEYTNSTEIYDVAKVVLTISRWSEPEAVVKILEFYTPIAEEYDGDTIVSIDLLEESELSEGSLPIGNISSNEMDLSLQNVRISRNGVLIDDPFFNENSLSVYHQLVKKNRKIVPFIGFQLLDNSVGYVKLGTFWSGAWSYNELGFTVSTSGRDRMELLRKATFSSSILYNNVTLYDLAVAVCEDAKINIPMPDLVYEVDDALNLFTIEYAFFPRKSYFETIRDIVSAGLARAYMDKDDVLIIRSTTEYAVETDEDEAEVIVDDDEITLEVDL